MSILVPYNKQDLIKDFLKITSLMYDHIYVCINSMQFLKLNTKGKYSGKLPSEKPLIVSTTCNLLLKTTSYNL